MEEAKETIKKAFKKIFGKKRLKRLVIIILIVMIFSLAGSVYFITINDSTYSEDDWSSTPYAAGSYINSINVNEDGTIGNSMTAEELWNKMLENGSRVDEYLDSPEELARLMKAEVVTQYPDTRPNPDEEINWEEVIGNSDTLQGIIKFKRADSNENKSTMTYADPNTFQSYIDEYNATGSETAKKNALTHFTLKKTTASEIANNRLTAVAAGDGIMTDVSQAIIDAANSTGWPGANLCSSWVSSVYQNAGLGDHRYVTAYKAYETCKVSTDISAIPIGAAVYGTGQASGGAGHVGIYIGDGKVIDSVSTGINVWNMDEWLSWQTDVINGQQGWLAWGWQDGNKTRGTTQDPNIKENDSNATKNEDDSTEKDEKETDSLTQTATVVSVSGDGYSEEYISSAGIRYKHFKQIEGSYTNNPYWDATIYYSGCGPTSVAILASGLTDLNLTPAETAAQMMKRHSQNCTSAEYLKEEMDSLGMTSEINYNPTAEDIKNNLKNGKVMLVSVNSSTIFTGDKHIMAIVDINSDDQVYICNPSSNSLYGWYDVSEIMKGCNYIVTTEAGAAGIAKSSNDSTYTAVVATWKQVDTTLTTDDPNVEGYATTSYSMTTTNINYEEMVDVYTMPFDLLWAFLVVGEDKDFVFELADLVYGSDIEITVYDNLTVNTNIDDWKYTQQTKAEVWAGFTANCQGYMASVKIEKDVHEPYKTIDYTTTKKVVTQTNTINATLTKANTWIVDYKNDYTYIAPIQTSLSDENSMDDEEYPSEYYEDNNFSCAETEAAMSEAKAKAINKAYQAGLSDEEINTTNISSKYIHACCYQRYINITDSITNTVSTQKYIQGMPDLKEKVDPDATEDNFVTIFNKSKYKQNKSNIKSASSWLFEILETNDSTKDNMVDLVKYLLYKATGISYGGKEISFDEIFSMKQSSTFGQISGNTIKEQVWNYLTSAGFTDEVTAAIMGNMEAESGVDPTKIQGGGTGPAAGICQWENYNTKSGRWKKMYEYATNRGKDWTDLQSQLDFLLTELPSTFEAYTGNGKHYYGTGEWCWWPTEMTLEDYKELTDIDLATEIFCRVFERPSITHLNRRIEAAYSYYNLYHGQ